MSDIAVSIQGASPIQVIIVGADTGAQVVSIDTDQTLQLQVNQGVPGPGVPPGGSAGQLLGKASSADRDTVWTFAALASLSDALLTSPSDGQLLRFDAASGKWRNYTPPGVLIGTSSIPPSAAGLPDGSQYLKYLP